MFLMCQGHCCGETAAAPAAAHATLAGPGHGGVSGHDRPASALQSKHRRGAQPRSS